MVQRYGRVHHALLLLGLVACWSGSADAQTITGIVTDDTGAVLPGVTVEGRSPALIERARVVVTDSEGRYRMVNLPVGTFAVTFTLEGFRASTRPDIQLTTNFTATVNIQLGIGGLAESLTVTSDAPLVDIRVRRRHRRSPVTCSTCFRRGVVPKRSASSFRA